MAVDPHYWPTHTGRQNLGSADSQCNPKRTLKLAWLGYLPESDIAGPGAVAAGNWTEVWHLLGLVEFGKGIGQRFEHVGGVRRSQLDDGEVGTSVGQRGGARRRCGGIAVEADMTRQRDLCWVPPQIRAMLVQHGTLAVELRRRPSDEVPVLGKAGRSAERAPLAAAADADRRMRPLERLGATPSVGKLVEAARERGCLLSQEADDDLACFLEPVATFLRSAEREAVGAGLFLVPAGSDADFEASAGDEVERGRHVGEYRRVTVVDAGHEHPEPQPARRLGQCGEGDPAFQAWTGRVGEDRVEVVEGPCGLEQLDLVGCTPDVEHGRPGRVLGRGLNSEAHLPHFTPPGPDRRLPVPHLRPSRTVHAPASIAPRSVPRPAW